LSEFRLKLLTADERKTYCIECCTDDLLRADWGDRMGWLSEGHRIADFVTERGARKRKPAAIRGGAQEAKAQFDPGGRSLEGADKRP
jgi:hypothetical protein